MPATPATRHDSGFTLIEILVATIIAGIILVAVYGSFSRTLNTKAKAEDRAELWATGRDAVMRIADDVEGAIPPYLGARVVFVGRNEGSGAFLMFVNVNRGSYGATRALPGRTVVWYEVIPGGQGGLLNVVRHQQLFTAAVMASEEKELPEGPEYQPIGFYLLSCERVEGQVEIPGSCTRVINLQFRFFDLADGQWREEWDSTDPNMVPPRMPYAIEIILTLADERGMVQDFSTIVDLPLAMAQPLVTPRPGA